MCALHASLVFKDLGCVSLIILSSRERSLSFLQFNSTPLFGGTTLVYSGIHYYWTFGSFLLSAVRNTVVGIMNSFVRVFAGVSLINSRSRKQ